MFECYVHVDDNINNFADAPATALLCGITAPTEAEEYSEFCADCFVAIDAWIDQIEHDSSDESELSDGDIER